MQACHHRRCIFVSFTLFKLDSTAISILLNIIPTSSVDRTRLRVRKKLNWEGKQGLYESLVNI